MKIKKILTIGCVCLVLLAMLSVFAFSFSGGNSSGGKSNVSNSDSTSDSVITPNQPVYVDKTITENGTYNASDYGADGFSSITVNVPQEYQGDTISAHHLSTSTIEATALAKEWVDKTKYSTFIPLNAVDVMCTIQGGSNSGKYYMSDYTIRLYSSESATITIDSNDDDFHLIAVAIEYYDGILSDLLGVAIESKELIVVQNDSITFVCTSNIAKIQSITIIGYYS